MLPWLQGTRMSIWRGLSSYMRFSCRATKKPHRVDKLKASGPRLHTSLACGSLNDDVTRLSMVAVTPTLNLNLVRWYTSSSEDEASPVVTCEELTELIQKSENAEIRIIDLRDPHEVEHTGMIPTSVNIPLRQLEVALNMSPAVFKKVYGVEQPYEDDAIIFYCKLGVRSSQAIALTQSMGFSKVKHLPGGWNEWSSRSSM